ncbi:type I 3-dehydroquinate dehydratase, partial [Salinispira pacifica]
MICLSTTTRTIEEAVQEALTVSSHIDAVELRADLLSADELSRPGLFPRLLADAGVPRAAILAIRRAVDGGDYAGKEGERARLLESAVGEAAAAGRPFFAVELEEDFDPPPVRGAAAAAGSEVIRSLYDLSGVPDGLEVRLRTMARSPKEIIKAAVTPRSTGELA